SGWIFQIVSKKGLERSTHCRGWDSEICHLAHSSRKDLELSTHCGGWDFRLLRQSPASRLCTKSENSTNGSWWISSGAVYRTCPWPRCNPNPRQWVDISNRF